MVRPAYRSRSYKRIWKRTPSGETKLAFERRKKIKHKCARCGKELAGTPRSHLEQRKLSKTEKRPERPFGGMLCHRCLEELIKSAVRISAI